MRNFFKENDLFSGEIQQINNNGTIHIQTRNLKYGKLKNGILIKVNHNLIKKKKHQFIELINDIKAILGMNGLIWIYFSTIKVEDEYFTDDKNKINSLNKNEKPNDINCILIILFRNICILLNEAEIEIKRETIMRYYEIYMERYRNNVSPKDKDKFKKIIKIENEENRKIIEALNEEIINNNFKEKNESNNKMEVDE